jgi:hypothetical protein
MKNKRIIAFISREVRLHKVNDHVSPLWGTVYPLVQNSHQHYMETSVLENIIVCLTELSINYNYKELVRRWHWYPTTRLRFAPAGILYPTVEKRGHLPYVT